VTREEATAVFASGEEATVALLVSQAEQIVSFRQTCLKPSEQAIMFVGREQLTRRTAHEEMEKRLVA